MNFTKAIISPVFTQNNAQLAISAIAIGNSILNNATVFTGITPAPDAALAEFESFSESVSQAEEGSRTDKAHRNTLRARVKDILRQWAYQVNVTANGNAEIIAQSGFPVNKKTTPVTEVAIPGSPVINDSNNSGTVKTRVPAGRGAHSFQYRYSTKDPVMATESDYTEVQPGSSRQVISDLTPGTNYFISCRAIGSRNTSGWSEPTMYMVR